MKRTIFKNFCEFFTGKEEGRQELGYLSSIEIIKYQEDNFSKNFCEIEDITERKISCDSSKIHRKDLKTIISFIN